MQGRLWGAVGADGHEVNWEVGPGQGLWLCQCCLILNVIIPPWEGGRCWHREVGVPPSLEGSKAKLEGVWSNLGSWKVSLLMAGGGTK